MNEEYEPDYQETQFDKQVTHEEDKEQSKKEDSI